MMIKTTLFIADLHLSEQHPELTTMFVSFIQEEAIHAERLYILGDLFDFWIGDDERSSLTLLVQQQISFLTQRGIRCYFIQGNRDFLLGKTFCEACGMQLLNDYTVIDLYGTPCLICHGDTLCIDDVHYQRYRKKTHQKWRQRLFLCLPLMLRLKIAQKIRQKSQQAKQSKAQRIMDVNFQFVQEIMQNYQVNQLIHGHTHREAIHQMSPHLRRIVLGDWGPHMSVLEANSQHSIKFIHSNPTKSFRHNE